MEKASEKVKRNRFGEYVERTAVLRVGGRPYRVKQVRPLNSETFGRSNEWRLMRSQMVSILLRKSLGEWLIKSLGHFDGMCDGWVHDREDFKPLTEESRKWLIDQIETFDYLVYWNSERGLFEIYDTAIHDLELKPAEKIVVILSAVERARETTKDSEIKPLANSPTHLEELVEKVADNMIQLLTKVDEKKLFYIR